jgi:hypothetical protein
MYQEDTYEPDDDEARLEVQLADEWDRFEAEAEEAHAILWAGAIMRYENDVLIMPPRRMMGSSNQYKEVA